jgi:hypothetical protein
MKTIQTFNLGIVRDGIAAIRIRKDSDYGEFQVQFIEHDTKKPRESMTYFTTDKQDALDTAQFEHNRMACLPIPENAVENPGVEIEDPQNYWSEK